MTVAEALLLVREGVARHLPDLHDVPWEEIERALEKAQLQPEGSGDWVHLVLVASHFAGSDLLIEPHRRGDTAACDRFRRADQVLRELLRYR